MDDIDVTTIAKTLEARVKQLLTTYDAHADVNLTREEAVLTLGMLSALVGILEQEERGRS